MVKAEFQEKGLGYTSENLGDMFETPRPEDAMKKAMREALDDFEAESNIPYPKEVEKEGDVYGIKPPKRLDEVETEMGNAVEELGKDLSEIVKQ